MMIQNERKKKKLKKGAGEKKGSLFYAVLNIVET